MKEYRLTYLVVLFGMVIAISDIFLQDSIARDIRATNEAIQGHFSLSGGGEFYQILCKEYGEEYTAYYRMVREKIVQKLKHSCKSNFNKGDVKVIFVLNSNGTLNGLAIDVGKSTDDKGLIKVVLLSLQQAAPFPPFPKELSATKLPFSVTVAFKNTN